MKRFADLRFSRRDFVKATAATAAFAPFMSSPLQASTPKKGGHFRVGLKHGNTTDSYDPAQWNNGYAQLFAFAREATLTEIAPDNTLAPSLAESWEPSSDATTWTFNLVKGATFSNGKDVTAEDVIASFNYHRGEESKSAAKPIVSPIKEMKADGKNRIIFTLESGNADFPFVVSDYHLVIRPAKDGKIDPEANIGAGGYVVKAYEPGVRAEVERRNDYWKTDRAFFDSAEILTILDPTARMNALLSNSVEAIDSVDLATVELLKRNPGIEVLSVSGTQHFTFAMDTRADPFKDNNVRLALKYGIKRQELIDKILYGYGSVGNDHPIGPSNRYYASELEQREYDADKAKYHLKQAGLDSVEVSLSAADAAFQGAVDAAQLFEASAAAAGIKINIVREANDGYWSNVWMKRPFTAVYWGGRPTEDWMFSTAYSSGASWNDTFWENARFNELLGQARSELDEAKRRQMYVELQSIVRDDGGAIIPMFASYVMAHSKKIAHGEKIAANWAMDGWRCIERWWYA